MRFVIGTRTYRTKGEAQQAVRDILHGVELDTTIVGDRGVLLGHLFALHPEAAEKAASGVIGHMVRLNDFHGTLTRGFHVVHPSNHTTAWSYFPCFNPSRIEPSVTAALRAAIMLSQASFRRQVFAWSDVEPCGICSKPTERKFSHIHHLAPKFF